MDPTKQSIAELEQQLLSASKRLREACEGLEPTHKGGEWEEYHAAHAELMQAERALAAAVGEQYAVPIDFPAAWDVGAPMPCLLKSECRTFITFFMKDHDPNWDGTYVTVRNPAAALPQRIAVVEFKRCLAAKLGSPNDEVFEGHPLHGKGLESYTAQEVINSRWLLDVQAINAVHSKYNPDHWKGWRHYIFWFHDSTFECLAESFEVQEHLENLPEILAMLCQRLVE